MPNSLVIGGNGFLGSSLVDALVSAGHEVTVFDRFTAGIPVFAAEGVRVVTGDFLASTELARAVDGQDFVFHFLSTTDPASADNDPTIDLRTNVSPTVALLSACVAAGVRRVYYASTGGAIYGNQPAGQYSEGSATLPQSPYAIGKLAVENYLRYFALRSGLDSVSLRISNPYGPRQHPNKRQGLIPIALRAIALEEPIIRFGDGSMVRDYIYVDDAITMIMALVEADAHDHDVYNIGSGVGHTVAEVIETLAEVTGVSVAITEKPVPPTFVDHVILDTSRYRAEFPFANDSPLSLRDGVALTWAGLSGRR